MLGAEGGVEETSESPQSLESGPEFLEPSLVIEMSKTVQYWIHQPHAAREHLKCS